MKPLHTWWKNTMLSVFGCFQSFARLCTMAHAYIRGGPHVACQNLFSGSWKHSGKSPQSWNFLRSVKLNLSIYLWKEILSQQRIRHFKILQSIYFAYDVGIISSYSNRIKMITQSRWLHKNRNDYTKIKMITQSMHAYSCVCVTSHWIACARYNVFAQEQLRYNENHFCVPLLFLVYLFCDQHKRCSPPLNVAFWKWPPSKLIAHLWLICIHDFIYNI